MVFGNNFLIILIFSFVNICICEFSIEPPTPQEIQKLEKFKKIAQNISTHNYQKEDAFLLNWLRGSNMDIENAKRRLEKSMQWRHENKIDTILDEPEIKAMNGILKYSINTVDIHGHPLLDYPVGQWNIRKYVLNGKSKQIIRYWYSIYEAVFQKMLQMNVSNFVILADVTGYSLRTHACLACLEVIRAATINYELNYSAFAHNTIAANAPRATSVVVDVAKPFISPVMAKSLKILGVDPIENKAYLSKIFNPSQLRRVYGGELKNEF